MRTGFAVIGVMFLLALCPASAAPSFLGYTGLLVSPNTGLVGEDAVDLAIHNIPDADFGGADGSLTSFTGSVGLGDNVELTAALFSMEDGDDDFTFHVKYGILKEPEDEVSLAVGLIDILEEIGDSVPIYVALGKDIASDLEHSGPVPITIGLAFGDDATALVGDGDADEVMFFASVSGEIREKITLMAEVLEEEFNFGARLTPSKNVNIDVGSAFDEFMWGVSYHTTW